MLFLCGARKALHAVEYEALTVCNAVWQLTQRADARCCKEG